MSEKIALLKRLVDALESAVDWAGYASEYFREKHGHQLDIDKLDAARDELAQAELDAARQENCNSAPTGGQSKTELTESHSGTPDPAAPFLDRVREMVGDVFDGPVEKKVVKDLILQAIREYSALPSVPTGFPRGQTITEADIESAKLRHYLGE